MQELDHWLKNPDYATEEINENLLLSFNIKIRNMINPVMPRIYHDNWKLYVIPINMNKAGVLKEMIFCRKLFKPRYIEESASFTDSITSE